MRIAVLSDIHGNLAALEAVLADVARRGVDAIVNLGDSLAGPLLPLETARFLMAQAWPQLAGNHERQMLTIPREQQGESDSYASSTLGDAERAWLASLRPWQRFSDELFLCHGTPNSDMDYLLESVDPGGRRLASRAEVDARLANEASPVVVCGHSHVPRSLRSTRAQLIVNPGSVGLQAYDARRPHPHTVENGSPDARYAVLSQGAQGWHSELCAVPYDHAAMAALARKRGRADWEHAILTGYVLGAET